MAASIRRSNLHLSSEEDTVVLDMEPLQGWWTSEQYLRLTDQTNRLIEFTNRSIEVLPMPTERHQLVVRFVFLALLHYLQPLGGMVLFAPLRLRIGTNTFREPDILLVQDTNDPRRTNRFWLGADVVVEVVSPDNPARDTVEKRIDYAEAGIPEYWIVNPADETITVLELKDEGYVEHGVFERGDEATSVLLSGFVLNVDATFDAGNV